MHGSKTMMRNVLRRIRGAIGMGFTWAVAWAAVGGVPRWVFGIESDLPFPLLFGGLGFVAGITFSGILLLTQRHRRLDRMSIPRFAVLGAVGGLLIGAFFVRDTSLGSSKILAILTTFGVACAVSASGSLALARRSVSRELPAQITGRP